MGKALLVAALAGSFPMLPACGSPPPASTGKPVVRIAGSETVTTSLARMLADTHERTVGTLEVDVRSGGTTAGLRELLTGQVEIAAASRLHTFAEEEQARANGYSLDDPGARHLVAVDVVAIVVHPSNPLDSLTYDQVIGIFCTRAIDNWSYLGLDDLPVRPATREAGSGTRALFEDFFCGPSGIHARIEPMSTAEANALVRDDPGAISFVSMSEVSGKVLGLRPETRGHAMLPSQQNILRGAYPLYHDLYLYTPGTPSGPTKEFVDWIATPAGQEVVDEARFVPLFLRPQRLDEPRPLRETIHFEVGSSDPNQRSQARLKLLIDELRERAGETRHVVLEGYTDPTEPNAVALSTKRAEAVKALLAERLPGIYFEIIPRGAANPIAPNETPYGRMRNRRVAIYLADEEKGGAIEVTTAGEEG